MLPKLDRGNMKVIRPRVKRLAIEPTYQNRDAMDSDMKDYVLNPEVPDYTNPVSVYRATRPFEEIKPGELIHHINGNHDDNRPKNLKKVTYKQHGEAHAKMRRDKKKPKEGA